MQALTKIEITNCEVDGHGASWQHIDGFKDLQLKEPSVGVHQHEALRAKFASLNRTINKCDLHVRFPDNVKVTLQDRDSGQATHDLNLNGANENGNEDEIEVATPAVMPTPMTPFGLNGPAPAGRIQYKPITVKIWFRCVQPALGLRFVDCTNGKQFPHAYTINHPIPCSTSLWLPCLDGIWERSTWEISISVPKTLADIGRRTNDTTTTEQMNKTDSGADEVTEPGDSLDISVVCSGDFVDEIADTADQSRKIVSFAQSSPVGASHIGFAVGPFESFTLSDLRDSEEDDLIGSSAVDVYGHCLPGSMPDLQNTCFPIYKAMDFFVKEYGSFPFTSYQVCFLEDMEVDSVGLAGLSLVTSRMLFQDRMLDPIYDITKKLVIDLAAQWIGVNIVPRSWSDTWLTLGISHYIAGIFLRKLMGNNDYRFRLKQSVVKITEQDIGKPPISSRDLEIPIDPDQTEFIALKSPVVLHMLDTRLTRAGSNLGLGRVIPKIFLQALSGELANGILSTEKFLRQCEKVAHIKLEDFARQWIFGHGYPKFSVVQRFNKKKMQIEMGIRQQQFQDIGRNEPSESDFVDDSYRAMTKPPLGPVEAIFSGPLTIRIHEADGTPYEHIIELKDQYHKVDIPYNNKYRRRVRTRKAVKAKLDGDTVTNGNDEIDEENSEQVHINCLGDGFQSDQDHTTFRLEDWSTDDEEKMSGEAFEWIRLDASFEWICTMQVGQPDYMYHSQLQQDRDVVAQYEAIQYFSTCKPSPIISTILFRTIMDERYYYGIRQLAALALPQGATEEMKYIGSFHLKTIFQKLYCYPLPDDARLIPLPNNFSDVADYFLRRSLLLAMASIRVKGYTSPEFRRILFDQLRHNDNSVNVYDDTHYLTHLLDCITTSLISTDAQHIPNLRQDSELKIDLDATLTELERWQRMDRWRPSYENIITERAIQCKERLMQAGLLATTYREMLDYTREQHYHLVRHQAFSSMLNLGALREDPLVRYILYTLQNDPSSSMRHRLACSMKRAIGCMAVRGIRPDTGLQPDIDDMIVEEDTSVAIEVRKDRELRTTMEGALTAFRQEFGEKEVLKQSIWQAVNDPYLALLPRRHLLDICKITYETKESRILKFKIPSMKARLVCKKTGPGKVVIIKEKPFEEFFKKKTAPVEKPNLTKIKMNKPVKIVIKIHNSGSKP